MGTGGRRGYLEELHPFPVVVGEVAVKSRGQLAVVHVAAQSFQGAHYLHLQERHGMTFNLSWEKHLQLSPPHRVVVCGGKEEKERALGIFAALSDV